MNCWEFRNCKHIPEGGLEVCPAYPDHGSTCARVPYTLCDGSKQETFAVKLADCVKCDFYKTSFYDRQYIRETLNV
jgi:hypothetical protein